MDSYGANGKKFESGSVSSRLTGTFSIFLLPIRAQIAANSTANLFDQVRKAKPLHMDDRWVTDSPKWVENKKEDTGVAHVSS